MAELPICPASLSQHHQDLAGVPRDTSPGTRLFFPQVFSPMSPQPFWSLGLLASWLLPTPPHMAQFSLLVMFNGSVWTLPDTSARFLP